MGLPFVVPSPSWPQKLSPQHLTPPVFVSAQVLGLRTSMAATPEPKLETSTGVGLSFGALPSPSWPEALRPQHLTPLAVVRAQV